MTGRRHPALWVRRLAVDGVGTMHELVLEELRTVILAGHAPPGTAINVDDVAGRFDISRIPVREALKTLVGEGLVDHQPRSGYVVAQLTHDELTELYLVREALEGAALGAAVRNATAADDEDVSAAHAALGTAILRGDSRGHHRESRRFHLALTAPAQMHRLLRMYESAWNITEPVQAMSHVSSDVTRHLQEDHDVMLAAFLRRDLAALRESSAAHHRLLQQALVGLPRDTGLFS